MILSFKTHWGKEMPLGLRGQQTFFVEKIWQILFAQNSNAEELYHQYMQKHIDKFGEMWDFIPPKADFLPFGKGHSIRSGSRWKDGMLIHPVINSRTSNYFQFAPILQAQSVQNIFMTTKSGLMEILIDDNKYLSHKEMDMLSRRDGFDNYTHFEHFFSSQIEATEKRCFYGQIIHWTDFKY